jgi:CHASE2 domain-containing sensor protein
MRSVRQWLRYRGAADATGSRRWTGVLIALLPAAVGGLLALTDDWHGIERRFGLPLLFEWRDSMPPPAGTVVVNIDAVTSEVLELPRSQREWPRSVHACVLNRLQASGARLVVFDINFVGNSAPPLVGGGSTLPGRRFRALCEPWLTAIDPDRAFAAEISRAGNVMLVQPFEEARASRAHRSHVSCRGFENRAGRSPRALERPRRLPDIELTPLIDSVAHPVGGLTLRVMPPDGGGPIGP